VPARGSHPSTSVAGGQRDAGTLLLELLRPETVAPRLFHAPASPGHSLHPAWAGTPRRTRAPSATAADRWAACSSCRVAGLSWAETPPWTASKATATMSLGSLGSPGRLGWVGSDVCRAEPTDRRLSPNALIMRALQSGTNPWSDTRSACVGWRVGPSSIPRNDGRHRVGARRRIPADYCRTSRRRQGAILCLAGDRLQSRFLPARTRHSSSGRTRTSSRLHRTILSGSQDPTTGPWSYATREIRLTACPLPLSPARTSCPSHGTWSSPS
jgi:hypothetical protein